MKILKNLLLSIISSYHILFIISLFSESVHGQGNKELLFLLNHTLSYTIVPPIILLSLFFLFIIHVLQFFKNRESPKVFEIILMILFLYIPFKFSGPVLFPHKFGFYTMEDSNAQLKKTFTTDYLPNVLNDNFFLPSTTTKKLLSVDFSKVFNHARYDGNYYTLVYKENNAGVKENGSITLDSVGGDGRFYRGYAGLLPTSYIQFYGSRDYNYSYDYSCPKILNQDHAWEKPEEREYRNVYSESVNGVNFDVLQTSSTTQNNFVAEINKDFKCTTINFYNLPIKYDLDFVKQIIYTMINPELVK